MGKKKKKKGSSATSVATKPPTGLSISRSGGTFTCNWHIGDSDYAAGQQFCWNRNGVRQWGAAGIGTGDTSRNVYPNMNGLTSITFSVRGIRKSYQQKVKKKKKTFVPYWSGWANYTYTLSRPYAPSVSYELDSSNAYSGKFSWSIQDADNTTNSYPFLRYEWESILVYKHNSSNPPSNWSNGGSADGVVSRGSGSSGSGSWSKHEDTAFWNNPDASYARWFRVRSVGSAGATGWRYSNHVYAVPRPAYNVTAKAIPRAGDAGYSVAAEWTAPESIPYPIDNDIITYAVVKPRTVAKPVGAVYELTQDTAIVAGKTYYTRSGEEGSYIYTPVENPVAEDLATYYESNGGTMVTTMDYPAESPSWTTAGTIIDTSGKDAMTFSIPEVLDEDECIFVKIDTKHDSFTTVGVPVLAEGGVGPIAKPKVKQIVPNPGTHRVQIQADNNSSLEASFLAIYYRTEDNPDTYQTIGILKHANKQITVQCPDWGDKQFSIGVQALVADYSPIEKSASGVTEYSITNIRMQSDISWDEGRVPMPPKYVELSAPNSNTIRVLWDWTWTDANKTELSWADHADAWESTDGPQTYEVTDLFAGAWNIAGVAVGTWYVRARLIREDEDSVQYGLYSDIKQIKLSSAPAIPSLILSSGVVHEEGEVTCYWAYVSTDGTAQMQADICEATLDPETNKYTYGDIIDKTASAQHLTIPIQKLGWKAGETHYLAVRVISVSGEQSQGWSTPVPIRVAEPLTVRFDSTSLDHRNVVVENPVYILTEDTEIDPEKTYYTQSGEEPPYTYTEVSSPVVDDISTYYEQSGGKTQVVDYLTNLPLNFTVSSNGAANSITVMIERSTNFHMRRPDESELDGYEGEIVATKTFDGDGSYTITKDDLIGYLDDDANYRLIAIGKDSFGQSAKSEEVGFTVNWEHQAVVPSAECQLDEDNYAVILTPLLPDGYEKQAGDVCDIYRLSVDAPELIYENAEFGKRYVDPYPTLGDMGGHRFVFKTANGDYTTHDNHIAWYDTRDDENDYLDLFSVLIDFNGDQISLPYNVQLSNRWAKDFQQTNYLGGSVQGDWNPAVNRTGSVSTIGIATDEFGLDELDGTIEAVRRLATYPGICHIRTPDGSSYSANINVSEDREEKMINKIAKYSLEITAVDSQELDGVTYELWEEMNREEE